MVTSVSPGANLGRSVIGAQKIVLAGNVGKALALGQVWVVKTAIITTDATVANRQILISNVTVSSKIVAASQNNADLIDREVILVGTGATTDIAVNNGQAGDTYVVSAAQLA